MSAGVGTRATRLFRLQRAPRTQPTRGTRPISEPLPSAGLEVGVLIQASARGSELPNGDPMTDTPADAPGRLISNTTVPISHPWPADCPVQGGAAGVVFREAKCPYRTAFVEAFPAGTLLRGEGETIRDAEDACWAKYQRLTSCPHDQGFERRQYVNGSGFCKACGTWFPSKATGLEPLPEYYERSSRPRHLLDRVFSGDDDALMEILSAAAKQDQLPAKDADRD